MADNVTHHEPPIDYPAAPDVLQTAKDYDPGESDKTMMTVRRFPVFLRQGLEALSREPDGGGSMERTVGAMLELGLPIIRRFPGVAECQDARQALLLRSRDAYVRHCQVNIARTGFASDEIATQTLDLDTRRLTPDPEATFA